MIAITTIIPDHLADLNECFENTKGHKIMLKPDKCTFGVEAEKFMEFTISQRGSETNPEKIKSIMKMQTPWTQKGVRKLAGYLPIL